MKKHIKRKIKRALLMVLIFFGSAAIFFARSNQNIERAGNIYAYEDDPDLPILFAEQDGILFNPMNGHFQDMGNKLAFDSITPLPPDRLLHMSIIEFDNMVVSAKYEIRSLDMSNLVERGVVNDVSRQDGRAHIFLPIQNLIHKDRPYMLIVSLDLGEQRLSYYTRILWTDENHSTEMLRLASEFTLQTFSKEQARNLTVYLESNAEADNSTLNHVNIHSSFNQITFGQSGMRREGEIYLTLKQMDGMMGEVRILYASNCFDKDLNERHFWNEDCFVFRYDPQRMFIMNFDRRTEEQFYGEEFRFSGKHIQLGVGDAGRVQVIESPSGQFCAFRTDSGLYRYDNSASNRSSCINLYEYLKPGDNLLKAAHHKQDIKILNVKDNGDVDFLFYGYENKGPHEGYCGIIYYTYDNSRDTIVENLFLPMAKSFEMLKSDLSKLCYLNEGGMLFIYYNGTIYSIDTTSLEVLTVEEGLNDSGLSSSEKGRFLAFQSGERNTSFHSEKLALMDLWNESTKEITEDGAFFRIMGFLGDDLVYGLISSADPGALTPQYEIPVREIRIAGSDLALKKSYSDEGKYLSNFEIKDGRIHFDKFVFDGKKYHNAGYDSIISNKKQETQSERVISYQDERLSKCRRLEVNGLFTDYVRSARPEFYSVERSSSINLEGNGIDGVRAVGNTENDTGLDTGLSLVSNAGEGAGANTVAETGATAGAGAGIAASGVNTNAGMAAGANTEAEAGATAGEGAGIAASGVDTNAGAETGTLFSYANASGNRRGGGEFYAYALGRFLGKRKTLKTAYILSYDDFGYVLDENFRIIWNRSNKPTVRTIKNAAEKIDPYISALKEIEKNPAEIGSEYSLGLGNAIGMETVNVSGRGNGNGNGVGNVSGNGVILNASGMDLNSALYYVGKGMPLIAYEGDSVGEGSYRLITAYDSRSITLQDPASGEKWTMQRNEAEDYYKQRNYPFVAIVEFS